MNEQSQGPDQREKMTFKPFTPKMQELKHRLDKIKMLKKKDFNSRLDLMDKIAIFSEKLRNKYPDFDDYEAYHVLAESGVNAEASNSKIDFDGDEYSIEKFIEGLEVEIQQGKK